MPDKLDNSMKSKARTNDADGNLPKRKLSSDRKSSAEKTKKTKIDETKSESESDNEIVSEKEVCLSQKTTKTSAIIAKSPISYKECKPCGKTFTGSINYFQHMNSENHKKVVCSESKKTYVCKTCNKEFTGPIPYDQHLKSKIHIKTLKTIELTGKFKLESILDSAKESLDKPKCTEKQISNAPVKELSCEICHKKFSGPIPYDMHLASKIHSKNVMKMVLSSKLEEQAEAGTNENKIDGEEPQLTALKEIQRSISEMAEKSSVVSEKSTESD